MAAGHRSRSHDDKAGDTKRTAQAKRAEEKGDDGDAPVDPFRLLHGEGWEEEMQQRVKQYDGKPSHWYQQYIAAHSIPCIGLTNLIMISAIQQWQEAQLDGGAKLWSGDADRHDDVLDLITTERVALGATGMTPSHALALVRSEHHNLMAMFTAVKPKALQKRERERLSEVAQDLEQRLNFTEVEERSMSKPPPPSGASTPTGRMGWGGWHRARRWTGHSELADMQKEANKAAFRGAVIDILGLGTEEGRVMVVSVLECFLTPRAIEENIRLWVVDPTRIGTYGFDSIEGILINGSKWECIEMEEGEIPFCSLLVRRLTTAGLMKRGDDNKIRPGGDKLDAIGARVGMTAVSVEAIVSLLYDDALIEGYMPWNRFILWACVRFYTVALIALPSYNMIYCRRDTARDLKGCLHLGLRAWCINLYLVLMFIFSPSFPPSLTIHSGKVCTTAPRH
jgi:hypothetical protein